MPRPVAYLLDTNVISETVRKQPDPQVLAWLDRLDSEQLHVSVLTLGEIRKGSLLAADVRRRKKLLAWLDDELPEWFEDRVLSVDVDVCAEWAALLAGVAHQAPPAIDSLLAATAAHHGLTVVTRNVRDFARMGVPVVNPWEPVPQR